MRRSAEMDCYMNILSPSILAADIWRLGDQIREVEGAGARYLHVDVMDGIFVPSISFGFPVLRSIRRMTDIFLDVHLMIERPERYVEEFADCGADLISFHIEAVKDIACVIAAIRAKGKKVGLVLKPATPVKAVEPYLELVDMVLVMTVEPGFGGQEIILSCVEKVHELRKLLLERRLDVDIQVDGGITLENVHRLVQAGANVIVAGSAVFQEHIGENVKALLARMNTKQADGADSLW